MCTHSLSVPPHALRTPECGGGNDERPLHPHPAGAVGDAMSLPKPYYEHDGITTYQVDSLLLLQESFSVDIILTDPPYNAANIGPNQRTYLNGRMKISDEEYLDFCHRWFTLCGNHLIVFTPGIANTHAYPQPKGQLCWHKPASVSFNRMGGYNAWEPIFVYGNTRHVRLGQDYLKYNTLNFTKGPERDHPCPKPLALWTCLVEKFSSPDHIILDPFMGSGTTLRVAKNLRRKAIGIEIEEKYCEISAKRLKQEVFDFT